MARINKNMSQANGGPGTLNMFARSELMKGWSARQEDGSLANVYGTHYNKTPYRGFPLRYKRLWADTSSFCRMWHHRCLPIL